MSGKHVAERDPFEVLGLPIGAEETEVRRRYLELVREHPPERDADRFREIHAAYQAAGDPLVAARRLRQRVPDHDEPPTPWGDIIDHHRDHPPRLSADALLALGNGGTGGGGADA